MRKQKEGNNRDMSKHKWNIKQIYSSTNKNNCFIENTNKIYKPLERLIKGDKDGANIHFIIKLVGNNYRYCRD